MKALGPARGFAQRFAPERMADRARRHERRWRDEQGLTRLAGTLGSPIVAYGPFAGLAYPAERLADVDAPVAKLLGTYEIEIHDIFDTALRAGVRTFVDIGCADGHFAVGMAYAAPALTTFAYDLAGSARELCSTVASTNGVSGRVRIGSRFTPSQLDGMPIDGALLLCDIEGAEQKLFDRALVDRLHSTSVIVEVHEDRVPGTTNALRSIFSATHSTRLIPQADRSGMTRAEIATWSTENQRKARSESRSTGVLWAHFVPR